MNWISNGDYMCENEKKVRVQTLRKADQLKNHTNQFCWKVAKMCYDVSLLM